jgi:hypothetical protein
VELKLGPSAPCASQPAIERRVAIRSERIRFVSGEEAAYVADARVVRASAGTYRATLQIAHPSGRRSTRSVEAAGCELALDALALVLAITLDPGSLLAAPPPRPPPARKTTAKQAESEQPDRPSPAAVAPRTALDAGPTGQALWGPAPGILPGFAWHMRLGSHPLRLWSPLLALSIEHAERDGFVATGGTARFALTDIAADICALGLGARPLTLRPCAWAMAGRLLASGSDTYEPAEVKRTFWVLGGSLLMGGQLGARFSILGALRAGTPLVRDAYQFEPNVFHPVSPWTFGVAAGIGYRWLQ